MGFASRLRVDGVRAGLRRRVDGVRAGPMALLAAAVFASSCGCFYMAINAADDDPDDDDTLDKNLVQKLLSNLDQKTRQGKDQ